MDIQRLSVREGATEQPEREFHGPSAARGYFTGTARVITGADLTERMSPGDVLVCPTMGLTASATPKLSLLVANAGALVMGTGGVLSNAATVARECGIPAVVAVGDAGSLIRDGQMIAVDGDRGQVRVLS